MIPQHILDDALFRASVPFFKVIVKKDGRLQGAIYNLTKARALHIAKRINDAAETGVLVCPEVSATAFEMVAPHSLITTIHRIQGREVTPRVVGTDGGNRLFLENQLAAVTGHRPAAK